MTEDVRNLAGSLLTDKQYEAFELVHRYGYSIRASAVRLGVHRSTFVDRYDSACLKLRHAGVRFTPDGRPYLEVT